MSALYPTKTRLALLKATKEDRFGWGRIYGEASEYWDGATGAKVTARIKEMRAHGWLHALPPIAGKADIRPTELGERILAEHGGGS